MLFLGQKLHLNGVKVYFLCNYQWLTHWLALSHLVCRSSHTPRPNHTPCDQGTKGQNYPILLLRFSKNPAKFFGATHRAGAWHTQVAGCLRIQLTLSLDRVASGQSSLRETWKLCVLKKRYIMTIINVPTKWNNCRDFYIYGYKILKLIVCLFQKINGKLRYLLSWVMVIVGRQKMLACGGINYGIAFQH